jgi:hypothetical protein
VRLRPGETHSASPTQHRVLESAEVSVVVDRDLPEVGGQRHPERRLHPLAQIRGNLARGERREPQPPSEERRHLVGHPDQDVVDDRQQVERDRAVVDGEGAALAFDGRRDLRVRELVGLAPEGRELIGRHERPHLLAYVVTDGAGDRVGEEGGLRRERLREAFPHVQPAEDLVGQVGRHRGVDLWTLRKRCHGGDPAVGVQGRAGAPDADDGGDQPEARQRHQHRPDRATYSQRPWTRAGDGACGEPPSEIRHLCAQPLQVLGFGRVGAFAGRMVCIAHPKPPWSGAMRESWNAGPTTPSPSPGGRSRTRW